MQNKEEYLNEEKFQKTNKKVNVIGIIFLSVGGLTLLGIIIGLLGGLINPYSKYASICGVLAVLSFGLFSVGIICFNSSHSRQMSAYMMQQHMPLSQEYIKKMSPSIGTSATEIAKGIKKGMSEDKTIYCKHCGAQVAADSNFCNKWGKPL